ncbi:hypothetical protein [Saccharopolyspora hattusasensis]|uniref:hypothetical protein n=1 Tax=Saccharopolyspora hattusasensis TaxID=1128679 RepID=UPI003D957BF9
MTATYVIVKSTASGIWRDHAVVGEFTEGEREQVEAKLAAEHDADSFFEVRYRGSQDAQVPWQNLATERKFSGRKSYAESPQPRDLTDEQDALAYDTFSELAEDGIEHARKVMRGIMRMGPAFTELDIAAWAKRYADENGNEAQRHHDEVGAGANGRV